MLMYGETFRNSSMYLLLGMSILLACVEKLATIMNTVSVERDWVVVIAQKDESALRQMNSQLRQIDLFCKLASPLVLALIDGLSTQVAILVTLCINTFSMVLEYALIARVYQAVPALASRDRPEDVDNQFIQPEPRSHNCGLPSIVDGLRIYVSQPSFPTLLVSVNSLLNSSFLCWTNGSIFTLSRLQFHCRGSGPDGLDRFRIGSNMDSTQGDEPHWPGEIGDVVPELANGLLRLCRSSVLDSINASMGGYCPGRWYRNQSGGLVGIRSFSSGHHTGGNQATVSWRLFDDGSGTAEFLRVLCIHLYDHFLQTIAVQIPHYDVCRRRLRRRSFIREVLARPKGSPAASIKVLNVSTWHKAGLSQGCRAFWLACSETFTVFVAPSAL